VGGVNEAWSTNPGAPGLAPKRGPKGPEWSRSVFEAGRAVFGLAMVGFGLVSLTQRAFLTSLQPVPEAMPGYGILAVLTGLVLSAAGLTITVSRGERIGALSVAVVFSGCIAFLHVPSAFTQPELLRSPWWIRTFESVSLVAGAMTLAGVGSTPTRYDWVRGGRIAFGISIPVFGVLHLVYAENVASLVPPWYPWPLFWAYATGVAQIAGGLAIAWNVWSRLAAILAGSMYLGWALTLHAPRVWCRGVGPCPSFDLSAVTQPMIAEVTSLFVAVGMAGAAWLVAGGVDAPDSEAPLRTGEGPSAPARSR
jgi:uncharacterized membrane protein YphA (DoxX/SURF4 family)